MDMSATSSPTYASSRCACCISGTAVSFANCTVSMVLWISFDLSATLDIRLAPEYA